MDGFVKFAWEYNPLMFPIIILFILKFLHIGSEGPFGILVPLSELELPPFSLALELGLEVSDVEGWTKNPLFGLFELVVAVLAQLLERMYEVLSEEEVAVLVE